MHDMAGCSRKPLAHARLAELAHADWSGRVAELGSAVMHA